MAIRSEFQDWKPCFFATVHLISSFELLYILYVFIYLINAHVSYPRKASGYEYTIAKKQNDILSTQSKWLWL